ncbi:MAG: WD40/YVTN/BNR-like repeat-containing protein [Myxococcota bacterium]
MKSHSTAALLVALTLVVPLQAAGTEPERKELHVSLLKASGSAFFLVEQSLGPDAGSEKHYRLHFTPDGTYQNRDDGIDLSEAIKASTGHVFPSPEHLTSISIQFVSPTTGFLYGYTTGYGYFPFLYRTADAGKTWQRLALSRGADPRLRRNNFFMFDDKRGIVLTNWDVYFITQDGGVTWSQRQFMLKPVRNGHLEPFYTTSGQVTVVIRHPDYPSRDSEAHRQVRVLRSDDFGATFRELR